MNYSSNSPSSSTSSSTAATTNPNPKNHQPPSSDDPMHSWWESISKARSRIHSLSSLLPSASLSSLADSDRPALSLLSSSDAYSAVSSLLISSPLSGSGQDPLCHWLYDTFLSSDPHLRLVVFSFLPLLSGLYLSRLHSLPNPSLAGFEAVLLAIYAAQVKTRNGKPVVVSVADLSQPSLYHVPPRSSSSSSPKFSNGGLKSSNDNVQSVGVLWPPLEPQAAVKSTKRACIVGVALDSYYGHISQMPAWSKIEFCRFLGSWAGGEDCSCVARFEYGDDDRAELAAAEESSEIGIEEADDDVAEEMGQLRIEGNGGPVGEERTEGTRIPLPWEILQPALRILGHCLLGPLNSQEVKDAASVAVRRLYARASHDLVPQAMLATQSLIQLDNRGREAAKAAAVTASGGANSGSNVNTPTKAKKPEILLVSK